MNYRKSDSKKPKIVKSTVAALLLLALPLLSFSYAKYATNAKAEPLVSEGKINESGLQIRSVDTQIVSKHWEENDVASINAQISLIRELEANYIAVSAPYDNPEQLAIWADQIHKTGLNVWFRSHWLDWEGDSNHTSSMTAQQYLDKTKQFVEAHPALFREGDAFTFCVEPEQVFTARKEAVFDWYAYNKFIIDQINYANEAFNMIGLGGKIHTNWISMNGWVVENGLNQEAVDRMGLITVDHYPNQDANLTPEEMALDLSKDLQRMHDRWRKPIILGEWGYNIEKEVSDTEQEAMLIKVFESLNKLPFLVGFNYWAHMGNSSRIIDDNGGANLKLRLGAMALEKYFE